MTPRPAPGEDQFRRKTMTTNTGTKTAEKKTPRAEVACKLDAEGKPIYSTRIAVWGSKNGKAKNFAIGNDRYVMARSG
jgi:hypothetical protein